MIHALLLSALAPLAPQEPADGAGAVPKPTALDRIRAAFTGSFLGVERKNGRDGVGEGHIEATRLPGGFIGRDYWSQGGGRRLYAGHDVLEFRVDGTARHWWFGSRGDEAYAEGAWTERKLVLFVLDGDGDRLRRYTYDLEVEEPLAFHFQNDHADGKDWEFFMEADWRRGDHRLPPDFQPDPKEARDSWRRHYVGEWDGPAGHHRGRWLFDEWLVLDTPGEHAVLSTGWFGKCRLRVWSQQGLAQVLEGRMKKDQLRLRPLDGEREAWTRVEHWHPEGYVSDRAGARLDFRKERD